MLPGPNTERKNPHQNIGIGTAARPSGCQHYKLPCVSSSKGCCWTVGNCFKSWQGTRKYLESIRIRTNEGSWYKTLNWWKWWRTGLQSERSRDFTMEIASSWAGDVLQSAVPRGCITPPNEAPIWKPHSLKKSKAILETPFKQAKICPVYSANFYLYIPVLHKGK